MHTAFKVKKKTVRIYLAYKEKRFVSRYLSLNNLFQQRYVNTRIFVFIFCTTVAEFNTGIIYKLIIIDQMSVIRDRVLLNNQCGYRI